MSDPIQRSNSRLVHVDRRQVAYKSKGEDAKASRSHRTPMLERWLDKGIENNAKVVQDRDEYLKGATRMSRYLRNWEIAWNQMAKNANAQK